MDFYELQKKETMCDIKLILGRKKFKAHRIILSAGSRFFFLRFNDEKNLKILSFLLNFPEFLGLTAAIRLKSLQ